MGEQSRAVVKCRGDFSRAGQLRSIRLGFNDRLQWVLKLQVVGAVLGFPRVGIGVKQFNLFNSCLTLRFRAIGAVKK